MASIFLIIPHKKPHQNHHCYDIKRILYLEQCTHMYINNVDLDVTDKCLSHGLCCIAMHCVKRATGKVVVL